MNNNITYSFFILLGACSYGIVASIVKLAYRAGYAVHEVTGSQYLFGLTLLLFLLPFFKRSKVSVKNVMMLMMAGAILSLTGILYGLSLDRNQASLAVVLLFQFTWIGILLESIYERSWPSREKIISIFFLIGGTILASNVGSKNLIASIQLEGIIYGLLSAFFFALFIFISGKIAKDVPTMQRSVFITIGGLVLVILVFSPSFMTSGVIIEGLWKYAILTAFFGVIFPIVFFAIGTPKVDAGLATIAGSIELPAAIVAAMFILGEHVNFEQFIGIILILIGISVPQLRIFIKQSNA
ncbi:EamA family transporter [Bacillus aquiflavi]|uniref:EamA family transporter n=1 Tax=Bacillus aquiflavi TaxID=2672567 RepID=A0A6B3VSJ3_9BACI|nr:EamA family transporter [Bacillus aquiflavi]MBA4536873.1 EamA family transporter [Bacillus aquiflavi]NEY81240.1 EamA family transporter [Bacillus aquiflavi]UAC48453.1 EamA family transporter [Bacillus aquiflavi]